MNPLLNDKEFIDYLAGKTSSSTVEIIQKNLIENQNDDTIRGILEHFWEDSGLSNEMTNQRQKEILDLIHRRTYFKKLPWQKVLLRAAIIGIPLLLGISALSLYLTSNPSNKLSLHTGPMQRLERVLPDGSKIWLNANSSLEYSESFLSKDRTVELSGEAFFDVEHNPRKPFIVETSKAKVRVLGTRFNLMAYPKDAIIEALLETGKLSFNGDKAQEQVMKPGEKIIYQTLSGDLRLQKEQNPEQARAWTLQQLVFRNESLEKVFSQTGHWYGVEFIVKDSDLLKKRYTVTLEKENLEQFLSLLGHTIDIHWKIKGNQVVIEREKP